MAVERGIVAAFIGAEVFAIEFRLESFAADTAEGLDGFAFVNALELVANALCCLIKNASTFRRTNFAVPFRFKILAAYGALLNHRVLSPPRVQSSRVL